MGRVAKNRHILSFLIWVIGLNIFAAILSRFVDSFFLVCNLTLIFSIAIQYFYFKFRSSKKNDINYFYRTIAVTATSFAFLILGPLNVDRSISVWMLHQIEIQAKSPLELQRDELNQDFQKLFTIDDSEFNKRINEQLRIGNIEIDTNNNIRLSKLGEFQTKLHRMVALFFGLNRKYAG